MPLSSPLQQQWQTVCERLPESLPASSLSEQAKSVLAFSDFVQESITANPDWLAELENAPPQADEWRHYAGWLQTALEDVADEATLMRVLRQFRRRVMVRIAWAQALELVSSREQKTPLTAADMAAIKGALTEAGLRRSRLHSSSRELKDWVPAMVA